MKIRELGSMLFTFSSLYLICHLNAYLWLAGVHSIFKEYQISLNILACVILSKIVEKARLDKTAN